MTIAQIITSIIIWLFGAFGIVWITSAISPPSWFVRNVSFDRLYKSSNDNWSGDRWWSYPCGIFILISVGRVVYCAAYAVTFVIPNDWGSIGEDGDFTSARFYFQVVIACFGSITLSGWLERRALADHRNSGETAEY